MAPPMPQPSAPPERSSCSENWSYSMPELRGAGGERSGSALLLLLAAVAAAAAAVVVVVAAAWLLVLLSWQGGRGMGGGTHVSDIRCLMSMVLVAGVVV